MAISCVDTNVCDTGSARIGEEYDVTGLEVCLIDRTSLAVQCLRGACGGQAKMFENIIHQSGAIESGGGGSTVYIRNSQIFRGLIYDGLSTY